MVPFPLRSEIPVVGGQRAGTRFPKGGESVDGTIDRPGGECRHVGKDDRSLTGGVFFRGPRFRGLPFRRLECRRGVSALFPCFS